MTYQPEWHPEHVNTKDAMERILRFANKIGDGSAEHRAIDLAYQIILDREREIAHLRAQLETERVRRWHATYNAAVQSAMNAVLCGSWDAGYDSYREVHEECSRVADAAHGALSKGHV